MQRPPTGGTLLWRTDGGIAMAANQSGFLVQSTHGTTGNFELVVPRSGGGVAHAWRDNDAGGLPWHGPSLAFGSAGDISSVALIQSSLGGVGNLELIARE